MVLPADDTMIPGETILATVGVVAVLYLCPGLLTGLVPALVPEIIKGMCNL